MELYLRLLEQNEKEACEEQPLGLILCAGADQKQIRLLQLDKSGIHVSEYLTDLPPREVLEQKLKSAMQAARGSQRVSKHVKDYLISIRSPVTR